MPLSYSNVSSGGSSSSANSNNNFTIMTGSNGYTRVDLGQTFPIGKYKVSSRLSDTTVDIYLIATDGTNAGYLAASGYIQLNISATKAFNKAVIYGATNDDVLTFEYVNVYDATAPSTTEFTGAAPRIISISTSDLPNANNTTTITGQNFATDVAITFTGTDSVARSAKSINRVSSTSLIVTRPDTMPTSASPYTITATNPGITAPTSTNLNKLTNSITAGNAPIWVTGATLTAYRKNEAYSQTVQATDADGGSSIVYSVVSGDLPTGITFNTGTATFSGTPTTNAASPYTYTIRATDAGNNYVDRAFTFQQLVPDPVTIGTATDVGTNRNFNNGAATVTFTPASTGPAATSYTVTSSPGGYTATGSSSPITVTGLQSNTGYTFSIVSNNASGGSLTSSSTSSITATTVPQAPTIGTATKPAATTASVPFTTNATGGKAISNYDITSSPGSLNYTGASSPISATSLLYGNTYTFQARAFNANGWSAYSASSNSISIAYPSSDSDNFNRTTASALGNSTGAGQSWSNLTGTWFANGSQAQSNDATAFAIIRMIGSYGTTQAGTVGPGTGLVYWASDANNLIASYPYYTTGTQTTCTTTAICGGTTCTPVNCCGSVFQDCERCCNCTNGQVNYSYSGTTTCHSVATCCSYIGESGVSSCGAYTYRWCSANQTSTINRAYVRTLRITGGSSSVVDDFEVANSTGAVAQINSLRVVTANSTSVSISSWNGANFGGTAFTVRTINPGASSFGVGVGVAKNAYGSYYSQSSTVDDFSASGF